MRNTQFLPAVFVISAMMASCMSVGPNSGRAGNQVRGEIYFLRQKATDGAQMEVLLDGKLVLTNGCLRIEANYGEESYAAIWPFEFSFEARSGGVDILDSKGQVVAQVGDYIQVSGGGGDLNMSQEKFVENFSGPYQCSEPHWIVGHEVTVITP